MEDKLLRYTLRVDRVLFRKFRYIAESEGRSANKEIEQYMKRAVAEYEKGNGKIEFEELPDMHPVIFYIFGSFSARHRLAKATQI